MNGLTIDFIDERYEAEEARPLTFGRGADIVIDEANVFMHRVVGAFVYDAGVWWLRNECKRAELGVLGDDGRRTTLPAGAAAPIVSAGGTVRFEFGVSTYELDFALDEAPEPPPTAHPQRAAAMTRDFGLVRLNHEQRLMLAALSEQRLRDPGNPRAGLPANSEVAHRLGWSLKKFDRKLDYLCGKLADQGVRGLRGGKGGEATERRTVLVDHVVRSGLVTTEDLGLLSEHDPRG